MRTTTPYVFADYPPQLLVAASSLVYPEPCTFPVGLSTPYGRLELRKPSHPLSAQVYARESLSCGTCAGPHFSHECPVPVLPTWDPALYQQEAMIFWNTCDRFSWHLEQLTVNRSQYLAAVRIRGLVPRAPPLPQALPVPTAPPHPPAIPLASPLALPKCTAAPSTSNRFAPLASLVDRAEPEVSPPLACSKVLAPAVSVAPSPLGSTRKPRRSRLERRLPRRLELRATENASSSLRIRVELQSAVNECLVSTMALIDSGATSIGFADKDFIARSNIPTVRLQRPIPVFNVDGTPNEAGAIDEVADVSISHKGHSERITLAVTGLGKETIILGYGWLKRHNPEIDWKSGTLKLSRCPGCGKCKDEERTAVRALRAKQMQLAQEHKEWQRARQRCCSGPTPHVDELEEKSDEDDCEPTADIFGCDTDNEFPDDTQLEPGDKLYVTHLWPEQEFIRATTTFSQRLAEAHAKNAPRSIKDNLPEHFYEYQDVFSKESFDVLPDRKLWDHAIELVPDAKPVNCKVYPVSPAEQKPLDEFIAENLRSGRIRPSKSPMASPVFFVKKKDGSLRFVQDYRALNNMTVKNRYPLPLINDLVNKLKGARYFTKLDVRWGFNNVRIREGDEWKAAFRTNRGLFEPLVMFFGLTNSPATFQTMMNDILHDLIMEGVVSVYLDDILIYTKTREEHRHVTRLVLERLRKYRLYLRPEKCEFEKTKIEYLGVIISHNQVEMDPVKVAGVAQWPAPTNKKEVSAFLGFTNFYRRFIEGFSHIARPLFDLTCKDTAFAWSPEAEAAFSTLKQRITSSPILTLPDDLCPFRVEADSSDFATGAVLSQQSAEDGKWHPVAFYSKSLSSVERNYEIYDKELLAVIRALEEWRHFLEGAQHPVEIWTDHKNLEYFRIARKVNRRQARWSLYLSRFDFTLHHRPGTSMGRPDALSRRADHDDGTSDNEGVVLLKPQSFVVAALSGLTVAGEEVGIVDDIKSAIRESELDEPASRVVKELKKGNTRSVRSAEWDQHDGLLFFRGKVYVPPSKELRRRIVAQHHDSRVAGHKGRFKTLELVTRNYWWPQMSRFIGQYTSTCDLCQRVKPRRRLPAGQLHPTETPKERWSRISVDFIPELPDAHGFDNIMVVVCRLGKRAHFIPCHTTINAIGAARLYYTHIWKLHGLPDDVLSDRGPQFVGEFTRELYRLLGITLSASTAYHPQTDGQTERVNQELEIYLRLFVNERHNDWNELLPTAEFAYNNAVHSSTQQTPFLLDTGRHPRMGFELRVEPSTVEGVDEFVERMRKADEEARAAIVKAKDDQKRYYDQRHGPTPVYKPGDKVWLDSSDIQKRLQTKFTHPWIGPFEVEHAVGPHAYRLKLPHWMGRTHPVFPVVKLDLSPPDPIHGRERPPTPQPEIIDGQEEWEVQQIVDSRWYRRKLQFKVWYKNTLRTEAEWTASGDVENASNLVAKFYEEHPNAPGREQWFKANPALSRSIRRLQYADFATLWYRRGRADENASWRTQRRDAAF